MGSQKIQAFQTVVASAKSSFCDAVIQLAKGWASFSSFSASAWRIRPPPLGFGVAGLLRAAFVSSWVREKATLPRAESKTFSELASESVSAIFYA